MRGGQTPSGEEVAGHKLDSGNSKVDFQAKHRNYKNRPKPAQDETQRLSAFIRLRRSKEEIPKVLIQDEYSYQETDYTRCLCNNISNGINKIA